MTMINEYHMIAETKQTRTTTSERSGECARRRCSDHAAAAEGGSSSCSPAPTYGVILSVKCRLLLFPGLTGHKAQSSHRRPPSFCCYPVILSGPISPAAGAHGLALTSKRSRPRDKQETKQKHDYAMYTYV